MLEVEGLQRKRLSLKIVFASIGVSKCSFLATKSRDLEETNWRSTRRRSRIFTLSAPRLAYRTRGFYAFLHVGPAALAFCQPPPNINHVQPSSSGVDHPLSAMASGAQLSAVLRSSPVPPNPCPRTSKQEKAVNQQYLTPQEEKALVAYVLQCAENNFPLPVKALRRLAWLIKRRRLPTSSATAPVEALQLPGKNWPQGLYLRHPELRPRRLKAIDWTRADENIIDKARQWFELIGKVLANSEIESENIYNMDETGVLLGRSATQKMLVRRDKARRTRGDRFKACPRDCHRMHLCRW